MRHTLGASLNIRHNLSSSNFFFNVPATTEIYTLSLHDALPISARAFHSHLALMHARFVGLLGRLDRKSTRLNSSHGYISYAVFCLKKKNPRWERSCRIRSAPA